MAVGAAVRVCIKDLTHARHGLGSTLIGNILRCCDAGLTDDIF